MINILDDPMALSIALRQQFDDVKSKNQLLRQQEKKEAKLGATGGNFIGCAPTPNIDEQQFPLEPDDLYTEASVQRTLVAEAE